MLNINKNNLKSKKGISTRHNPAVIAKASTAGITLIALVVTIIILIILAGVSINLVLGDEGLIIKAKNIKENQDVIQEKEHIKIAILDSKIRDASTSKIIKEKLEESLRQQLGNNVNFTLVENGSDNFTIKMNDTGRTYYLESTGKIVDDENILEISTAEELKAFRDEVNKGKTFEGKVICLTNNIILDINEKWIPIGLYLNDNASPDDETNLPFKGTFDGRGYEVDNIYINTTDKVQGLFGLVSDGGKVLNVGIGENCNITGGSATAGVVGYINNKAIVDNCYNKGKISGIFSGGVVGFCKGSTISKSYNIGSVEGEKNTGGLLGGNNNNSLIINCYNAGSVTGSTTSIGGLTGIISDKSTISNCYNIGKVQGGYYVGGIAGSIDSGGIITTSYNKGMIIANSATAAGNSCVGGICGICTDGELKDAYNTGSVTGAYPYVGGILGVNRGNLSNSYNIGNISGDISGGVVGTNDAYGSHKGIIKNSYSLQDNSLDIYGQNLTTVSPECSEKSSDELKEMESTLGDAFKNDEENVNQGYPILDWQ